MGKIKDATRNDYRLVLKKARASGRAEFVGNRYPWQCREAVAELSCYALERQRNSPQVPVTIRILTSSFPNYVFGSDETVKNLRDFLQAGGLVRVLVWNESLDVDDSMLLAACGDHPGFELRESGTSDFGDKLQHMVVVDADAYRIEQPHADFKSGAFDDFAPEIPAKIAFNEPGNGTRHASTFDQLWSIFDRAGRTLATS